jgi:hypothetical protein
MIFVFGVGSVTVAALIAAYLLIRAEKKEKFDALQMIKSTDVKDSVVKEEE